MSARTRTTSAAKAKTAKSAPTMRAKPKGANKAASSAKPPRIARIAVGAPRTLDEFMREALAMELDAAQRYTEFADAMETHNNLEVAALFRKMADIEGRHASQIMDTMGWKEAPSMPTGAPDWGSFEAPETTAGDEVHYLMQPYHVLELALVNEQRAERFFARLVNAATDKSVRKAARELQEEEREHVALVKAWMKKVPRPDSDWANDPDPARYVD